MLVQHAPVANDFFPVFAFRGHGYPCMVTLGRDYKQGAVDNSHSISRRLAETIQISRKAIRVGLMPRTARI